MNVLNKMSLQYSVMMLQMQTYIMKGYQTHVDRSRYEMCKQTSRLSAGRGWWPMSMSVTCNFPRWSHKWHRGTTVERWSRGETSTGEHQHRQQSNRRNEPRKGCWLLMINIAYVMTCSLHMLLKSIVQALSTVHNTLIITWFLKDTRHIQYI